MTASIEFYDIVKWLHITGVVVGFGSTFAYGTIIAVAMKTHPKSIPGIIAGVNANSRTLVNAGMIVILVTGIYMAADIDQFSEFYVAWGFIAIIALGALAGMVFTPNERKALKAAERDVEAAGPGEVKWSAEFEQANGILGKAGPVAGIIIVLTVFVMTVKPFL